MDPAEISHCQADIKAQLHPSFDKHGVPRDLRKIYVGNFPPRANQQTTAKFFNEALSAVIDNKDTGPDDAAAHVLDVFINHEKCYAFVEFKTFEEANQALALDGITFENFCLRVRRPSNYASLLKKHGYLPLSPQSSTAAESFDAGPRTKFYERGEKNSKLFIGNLPYHLTDAQVRELLESIGPLRSFSLITDRETGTSKGFAFCEYQDPSSMDLACATLNGLNMNGRILRVDRDKKCHIAPNFRYKPGETDPVVPFPAKTDQVIPPSNSAKPDEHCQEGLKFSLPENRVGKFEQDRDAVSSSVSELSSERRGSSPPRPEDVDDGALSSEEQVTRVVCLSAILDNCDLLDDEEMEEIFEDISDECEKFGTLIKVIIPLPKAKDDDVPGIGKVFLEYADTKGAQTAKNRLDARLFNGNTVKASYFSEKKFLSGDYDG